MFDSSGQFELPRPLWLAALAVLPLLLYYVRRTLVHFSRRQRFASLAVRVLLLALIVVALCGPILVQDVERPCVVAVADASLSVSGDSYRAAMRAFDDVAARQTDENSVGGLWFAAGHGPLPVTSLGKIDELCPDRKATNIAAALTAARAAVPAARIGHIVLFSDGNQTCGDALAAAKAAGMPVSVVPLKSLDPEVYVSSVQAPARVRLGEPFDVEVVVQATHDDDGTVELLAGPQVLTRQRKHLTRGENRFHFPHAAVTGPSVLLTARIAGYRDTLKENNQAAAMVLVGDKPRVLLVESQPALAEHLAGALRGENIEVEVRTPQDMPARLKDLRRYDLLILSNIPATSLPAAQMEMVRWYVRDLGGGLIVVGGDQTLTAGGYHGTTLEKILPVDCEVKREKPKPSLAMVLVLDCSGSMEGKSIELAKQATRRAVEMLGPRDQIGVLTFEDRSRWISPLHTATDKQQILEQIETIRAAGGTNMYPAMEKAYLALREVYADLKHIIVLTDGVSNSGDFEALTKEIAAAGISVSTVGVGQEPARPLLQGIAEKAKGHSYFCDDAAAVPQIFAMETISAGRLGVTEEPFVPQRVDQSPALAGLDFAGLPPLLGYVETQPKPGSQVLLAATAGEPLLASWRYGRGTSMAFTSDIQSRWSAAWLTPERRPWFNRFWVQLARQAMRKYDVGNCVLRATPSGGRVRVTLDAADPQGRFINGAAAKLKIIGPDQKSRELDLPQTAPGRYAGDFAAVCSTGFSRNPGEEPPKGGTTNGAFQAAGSIVTEPGVYYLETSLSDQGRLVEVQRRGIVLSYPEEMRVRPANTELLKAVARVSGGQYDPKPADLFAPSGKTVSQTTPLWPYLLIAALVMLVLDVALKRIEWKGRRADVTEAEAIKV